MGIQLTTVVFKDTNIEDYETYYDFVYCGWTNKDLNTVTENFCDLYSPEYYEEVIPKNSNLVRGLTEAQKKHFAIGIYERYSEEFESAFSAWKLQEAETHLENVADNARA